MTRRTKWIVAATISGAVAAAIGGGAAVAASEGDAPITGSALVRASAAALAYTGGGRVTETEVGDEDSYYEVEVTLPDGRQVDVQLDKNFAVVGSAPDVEDPGGR
jgi:uncharacterized membrane protein YkoI